MIENKWKDFYVGHTINMDTNSENPNNIGQLIYESPDGGKTIRARAFGNQDHIAVSSNNTSAYKSDFDFWKESLAEDNLWFRIRELAKTNPEFGEELERVKMLYYLITNHE